MGGSPIVRLLLVVVAMLALLVPLRSLTTHPAAPPEPAAVAAPEETGKVRVAVRSTRVPFHFEIRHLGTLVWSGDGDGPLERELAIPFPEEGIDLLVDGTWAEAGPSVLRVEVQPAGASPIVRMLWGEESVSDVLTFR